MLIKSSNIEKVFCMNGFLRGQKKGHKRRNESRNMAKSYFIYCIQSNLYHGLYWVRVFGSGLQPFIGMVDTGPVPLSTCLYFTALNATQFLLSTAEGQLSENNEKGIVTHIYIYIYVQTFSIPNRFLRNNVITKILPSILWFDLHIESQTYITLHWTQVLS